MHIEGSTAFITGANRGIGAHFVEQLVARGAAKVYAVARKREALEQAVSSHGKRVVPVELDITDAAAVAAASAAASDVDLLVNNAGVLAFGDPLDGDIDMFERDMATNYLGTLRMCQAFAPVIEANGGGAIVNMLTIVALAPKPGVGGYSASKAAAFSMTQGLRSQLADRPIAVHAAYPAGVDTDMLAGVDVKKADPGDVVAAILDGVQTGQLDIAPDSESAEGFRTWLSDPKALEAMFAAA